MSEEDSASGPKESAPLDKYGDSAREYIRSRRADTSAAFFLKYLKPGMTVLDCGCGEGTITADLTELVAPGQVIGLDLGSETLEIARENIKDTLTNLHYEEGTVYQIPYSDEAFDAVFSNALFEHLRDKPMALQEIKRVLKPGGVVGLRAPDFGAGFFYPPDPLVERYFELGQRVRDELGVDSRTGRRLRSLLHTAGFRNILTSFSTESYAMPERQAWFVNVNARFAVDSYFTQEWVERGLATLEELQRISERLQTWAENPEALFVAWTWCEVLGWKE